MTENMDKWPSRHRKTEKSGHRLAAEKTLFPRWWYGGMISANLEVIWEMSAKIRPSDGCNGDTVPLAVELRYDFPEFAWHLGNVE